MNFLQDLGDINKRKAVLSHQLWPNGEVAYDFTANVGELYFSKKSFIIFFSEMIMF